MKNRNCYAISLYEIPIEVNESVDDSQNGSKRAVPQARPRVASMRSADDKINWLQSFMHLMKSNIGVGILSLPIAFKHGGLWVSVAGMLLVGLISVHCMHLLVSCSIFLSKRMDDDLQMDYGHVAEGVLKLGPSSFRKFSLGLRITTNVFISLTQFGFCTAFIVFMSSNIQMVVEQYSPTTKWVPQVYQIIVVLFLIPYSCITNLRILSFFSGAANVLETFVLGVILYNCLTDLPPISSRQASSSFATTAMFCSMAIFTFEGIGMVMPLKNRMKKPHHFWGWCGVLNIGMIISMGFFVVIGFFGYWKFGEEVKGTITLNLTNTVFHNVVRLLVTIALFFTFAIQFYVPIKIMWHRLLIRITHDGFLYFYGEYILRIVFVMIVFVLAAVVPHLDLMISLVGALTTTPIALILPVFLDTVVCSINEKDDIDEGPGYGFLKWRLVKNIIIGILGVAASIVCTAVTIMEIVKVSKF